MGKEEIGEGGNWGRGNSIRNQGINRTSEFVHLSKGIFVIKKGELFSPPFFNFLFSIYSTSGINDEAFGLYFSLEIFQLEEIHSERIVGDVEGGFFFCEKCGVLFKQNPSDYIVNF